MMGSRRSNSNAGTRPSVDVPPVSRRAPLKHDGHASARGSSRGRRRHAAWQRHVGPDQKSPMRPSMPLLVSVADRPGACSTADCVNRWKLLRIAISCA